MQYHDSDPVFDEALAFVLKHEGGFVSHPDDPGGATKYGVSLRALIQKTSGVEAWIRIFDKDGDGDVDADDVRLFTIGDAGVFYRDLWNTRRMGEITHPWIAAKIFDQMVVSGFGGSSRVVQRALRACGLHVVEDGAMGSQTIAAVNRITDVRSLMLALRCESAGYFRDLDRDQFEAGWLNRAYDQPELT